MANIVQIVISLVDHATKEMKKVTDETGKMDEATKKSIESYENMKKTLKVAGGAFAGVVTAIVAVKKAFDFANEGAQLQRLEQAGQDLARSFGADMDTIVNALDQASLQTVAKTDLIASANRAMMLGLGADSEKLANLMQVAALRGRAMGLSTTQAFSDIVTGIGRVSPLILDNLGIVLDLEGTYKDYADSVGKSVDALSEQEKKQALLNGVLAEGNKMLEDTGGLVADNATQFERSQKIIADTTNELKMMAANALAPVVEGFYNLIMAQREAKEVADEYHEALRTGRVRAEDSVDIWDDFGNVLHETTMTTEDMKDALNDAEQALKYEGEAAYEAGVQANELYGATSEAERAAAIMGETLDDELTPALEDTKKATEDAKGAMDILNGLMSGKLGDEIEDFTESQLDLETQMANVRDEIDKAISQGYSPLGTKVMDLKGKYEDLQEQYDENADAHEEATRRILFDIVQQQAAVDGITKGEATMLVTLATNWGLVDSATADATLQVMDAMTYYNITGDLPGAVERINSISEAWLGVDASNAISQADQLLAKVGLLTGTHQIRFNISTSGSVPTSVPLPNTYYHQSGADFVIPPGYPNDSFPIGYGTSGERVIVIPKDEQQRSNNFTMNVHTNAASSTLERDFRYLQAMAG